MNPRVLWQWTLQLSIIFSSFSVWQVERLALFSLAAATAEQCQQRKLGKVGRQAGRRKDARKRNRGGKAWLLIDSVRRRLHRTITDKKWSEEAFALQWSAWVLTSLAKKWLKKHGITLIVDETTTAPGYRAMVVALAFQGRAIPLIMVSYEKNAKKGKRRPPQVKMIMYMLNTVKQVLPAGMTPLVITDRGLGNSPALCKAIKDMGWDYELRLPKNVKMDTAEGRVCLYDLASEGKRYSGSGTVFVKKGRVDAHVRIIWDKGHDEPWILVTNNAKLSGREYARRNWIEQCFRDWKSKGFQLQDCRLRCVKRINIMLAILTVAMGMALALGSIAANRGKARKLIRRSNNGLGAAKSLFSEGLHYLEEETQRLGKLPKLRFLADPRWA